MKSPSSRAYAAGRPGIAGTASGRPAPGSGGRVVTTAGFTLMISRI
ncbi:hypothetical protein [Promicromonospora sp. NPDC019610]